MLSAKRYARADKRFFRKMQKAPKHQSPQVINTARRTIGGYKIMNMIRKGQVEGIGKGDIRGQVRFVADLFNGAA